MTDIMREILAEAARINALNTAADTVIADMKTEISEDRKKKERHIVDFLLEMQDVLEKVEFPHNGRVHVDLGMNWYERNYRYSLYLQLARRHDRYADFYPVIMGRYMIASGMVTRDLIADICVPNNGLCITSTVQTKMRDHVINKWNAVTESMIMVAVENAAKATLAKRVETMQKSLEEAHKQYRAYKEG